MRSFPGRGVMLRCLRWASNWSARVASSFQSADISVFHEFAPPPNGGGHQFLRAWIREATARGWRVEVNTISKDTQVCLINSFNFDPERLRLLRRPNCRIVHRVDGPLASYRGFDDGTDRRIWEMNREFASATIFQSRYSLEEHARLGFEYTNAAVIPNASDPTYFFPVPRPPLEGRKIRLISTSWSDNRNKGAEIYAWLDENLDWNRYEYVFVGRLPLRPKRIRVEPPATTERVASLLQQADIFITASRNDPCSNSLIEALTCGLPAIYLNSGGHPELVGGGGYGFDRPEQIPGLLDRLIREYRDVVSRVRAPKIGDVVDAYLKVMGLPPRPACRGIYA
ncbi:MAG: glycosyltransferase family 4 protein [Kiritimatiellae bacterium]|nr:glycosyltransferase family 4 protein [Kiritimatiellia bacterium]MDW8458678.1 glycosyltransferase family 4 protein [Verrucomicrobiota bacterium]